MKKLLASLAMAAAILVIPTATYADNTKEAHRFVNCTWSYEGVEHAEGLYVLDLHNTDKEKASIENLIQYHALLAAAGEYHHEYPNYADYPTSVKASDLDNFKCSWQELP